MQLIRCISLFCLAIVILSVDATAQDKRNFPYEGGERAFVQNFKDHISELPDLTPDTALFLFVEVCGVGTFEQVGFRVFGAKENLKGQLERFLESNRSKWNLSTLGKSRIIMPVIISVDRRPGKQLKVDWEAMFNDKYPSSGNVFFVQPVIIDLYGVIVVDKD